MENNHYDGTTYMELLPPKEFNFNECLIFLGRSNNECLHEIEDNVLYKLLKLNFQLTTQTKSPGLVLQSMYGNYLI